MVDKFTTTYEIRISMSDIYLSNQFGVSHLDLSLRFFDVRSSSILGFNVALVFVHSMVFRGRPAGVHHELKQVVGLERRRVQLS